MPIICWGNLAKAANDTQRIEEAIQDYVELHNENVNAHQVYGSSLYMHRIEEELDHKLGSIDFKYLSLSKIFSIFNFESFDGWSTYGYLIEAGMFEGRIGTDKLDNDETYVWIETSTGTFIFDPSKNPFFQTTLEMSLSTAVEATFGFGLIGGVEEGDGFGFKFINGTEYAYWIKDSTLYTQQISNVVTTNVNVYRAYIDYVAGEIYFYVNGELVYTATENIPTDTNPYFFHYYIKTTTASYKQMSIIDLLITLDR